MLPIDNRLSGVDLKGNPDFVKLAAAYGIKGFYIRKPDEVDAVLAEASAYRDGACVVEAVVEKEDNVFPMVPAGAAASARALSGPARRTSKHGCRTRPVVAST